MIGFTRDVGMQLKFPEWVCAIIAGWSSTGGAHTEHRDVLADSTAKLRTEVPLEGSDPEPYHAHLSSETQAKCRNQENAR